MSKGYFSESVYESARAFIRAQGPNVVFINDVLEHLEVEFDEVRVTADVRKVIDLIETLRSAPGVHPVIDEYISFCGTGDSQYAQPSRGDE